DEARELGRVAARGRADAAPAPVVGRGERVPLGGERGVVLAAVVGRGARHAGRARRRPHPAPAAQGLEEPLHPYGRGLLMSVVHVADLLSAPAPGPDDTPFVIASEAL